MMAMQLSEEFSGRLGAGQTLSKEEVLTYNQILATLNIYFNKMGEGLREPMETEEISNGGD